MDIGFKKHLNADVLTEKDDWNEYEEIILSEGINYREGIFNFFGGVQEGFYLRLKKLNDFKGKVFCVNEMIDYNVAGEAPKHNIDKKTIDSYRDWNDLKDFKKYGI